MADHSDPQMALMFSFFESVSQCCQDDFAAIYTIINDGAKAYRGIILGQDVYPLRPGAVAIIPAGVPHSLEADPGEELEFIIFGTPPMAMDDDRAKPKKVT